VELLSEDEVMIIRRRLADTTLAQRAFGRVEPLFPDRLSSAVSRQSTGYGNRSKYNTVHEVAATLFYGLCLGHAFENGNKRTALVTMLVFLDRNASWLVDTSEDDLYDLATQAADHQLVEERGDAEVEFISHWLRQRLRLPKRGQRLLRFRELRKVLEDQGCEFDSPKGNTIKIRRQTSHGEMTVKAGYKNQHFEVPLGDVRRIRRALELDEQHGFDAGAFYHFEASVDDFVNKYRQLMNRLADR
jgi:death-on-curing protein